MPQGDGRPDHVLGGCCPREPAHVAGSALDICVVERGFCARCGTSLTIWSEEFPEEIYVAIASFDDSEGFAPEIHIWREDRLGWLETADDLPRYRRFRADGILEDSGR